MADFFDQHIDALFGGHLFKMEAEGEDDSGAAVHAPEEHSDFVLGGFWEAHFPEEKFVVEGVAFGPEGGVEELALGIEAVFVELLEVVAGDELVVDGCAGEVDVVCAKAHELFLVLHFGGGEADHDLFAAKEEGADFLLFAGHHGHSPGFFGELGDGDKVVVFDVFDRFFGEVPDHLGLIAGLDVVLFDLFEGLVPVVVAHLFGGLFHLGFAPGVLLVRDLDELLGRVGDHLVFELVEEGLAADWVADDGAVVAGF